MRNQLLLITLLCSVLNFSESLDRSPIHRRPAEELTEYSSVDGARKRMKDLGFRDDAPCPEAADIAPCTCLWLLTELYLDCTNAESNDQIAQIFQTAEFPVKTFFEFSITETSPIVDLDFSTNGVSFARFNFNSGPTSIATVSETVFQDSATFVRTIMFENSQITETGFPFDAIPSYSNLDYLDFYGAQLSSLPVITSDSLTQLVVGENQISELAPGSLDGMPNVFDFLFAYNQLTELKTGTISYTSAASNIDLTGNQIQSLEGGAFFDTTFGNAGYLKTLKLSGNLIAELPAFTIPLTAGSDFGVQSDIFLNNNQIATIEASAFYMPSTPGSSSINLDLSNNQITTIDETVFGPVMPYVFQLRLQGNPLDCGCDVAWLVTGDYETFNKVVQETTCSDGTPIHSLDPDFYANNC